MSNPFSSGGLTNKLAKGDNLTNEELEHLAAKETLNKGSDLFTEGLDVTPTNESIADNEPQETPQTEDIDGTPQTEEITQDDVEEQQVTESVQEFEEVNIKSEPTISDSQAFQRLSQSSTLDVPVADSYAELVENMVSAQCQLSGVKNLDLTTFGIRAQVLSFPTLSVLTYGVHKFLGAPFTEEEENMIIHRLGLHVAQSNKKEIVVRAVQEVKDARGMSFYSLLFTDSIAQKFANMFNYTVHANLNESDISKLVLVIQK